MSHTHRLIIVCNHVTGRPDVLWIESGAVQAAVCTACAAAIDNDVPASLETLCAECAAIEGIPVAAKMPDGFYAWNGQSWIQQAQTDKVV